MIPFLAILAGFGISLFLAHHLLPLLLKRLRAGLGKEPTLPGEELPAGIVGFVERGFFTIAVAANLPGVLTAMILWIAAKMAAHWGSRSEAIHDIEALRLTGLLGGMVSMLFALIGGGVVRMGWLMIGQ
jgi:hypothetical protein